MHQCQLSLTECLLTLAHCQSTGHSSWVKFGAFHSLFDWDHFSLRSCLQGWVSRCECLLWRPALPMCEELICEYKTMLVPGDHAQPLESSGEPLMAWENSDTHSEWFNCMHAFHCKSWPKASRRSRQSNQTILHGLLKSRFVLCQHKQFNLMFSLLSEHWVLHLNPREGEERFLFISTRTSVSESIVYSQWIKKKSI